MNNHFTSVFIRDTTELSHEIQGNSFSQIPPLQITGVTKLLKSLKTIIASAYDSLPNRILKEYDEDLSPALTAIFNQYLNPGELPEDRRNVNFLPVYRKELRTINESRFHACAMEHIIWSWST